MSHEHMTRKQEEALKRQEERYEEAKAEIEDLGFVLQGSIAKRWMECGNRTCRCHEDPEARHGPYYQWTWKVAGKTRSVYLSKEQAILCRRWIQNNRKLNGIVSRLRRISLRAARSYEIRE